MKHRFTAVAVLLAVLAPWASPRALGGQTTWENVVCSCVDCNRRKGGRTPAQAHMKLIRPPVQPRRNPAITLRLGWAKYQSFMPMATRWATSWS